MNLEDLRANWNRFGETDPLWAVVSHPSKERGGWDLEEFLWTGRDEVCHVLGRALALPFQSRLTPHLAGLVRAAGGGMHDPARERNEEPAQYFLRVFMDMGRQPRRRAGTALDFGCGVGRLSQALGLFFERVHGVDIAPSMVELARRYAGANSPCEFHVNDAADLGLFASDTFDFVLSLYVMQHMEPAYSAGYIRELIRVLAPGGVLHFQLASAATIPQPDRAMEDGLTIDSALPDSEFRAELTNAGGRPLAGCPGDSQRVVVRVRNASGTTWPGLRAGASKHPLLLGNHWLSATSEVLVWDDARAPLPADLAPLEVLEVELKTSATLPPGSYFLELDMVQEGVAWFAEKGSSALRIPVEIVAGAAAPVMEMHGFPKEEAIAIVESCGGRLLDTEETFSPGWRHCLYYVTK